MTDFVSDYFAYAMRKMEEVLEESGESIWNASQAVADAIANDKDFLTFGSGHSELVAKEVMWRAGGLAPAMAIQDHTGGDAERIEGMAQLILGHYILRAGSVMVVISNSGINPVPIEAAMIAKKAGLTVVVITSVDHSKAVPARHSSGKKLYEVADIVIDTCTPRGDVGMAIPNTNLKSGSTSTLIGVAIIDAITIQAAGFLAEKGIEPPLLMSANVPEGDAHNLKLKQKYMPRMSRFPVDTADMAGSDD